MIVTLDGPSGSGKSTLARRVAKELDIIHIDSGSIYRAIAYHYISNNVEEEDYLKVLDNIDLKYKKSGVILNNKILKAEIRSESVSNLSSKIAVHIEIRQKVNEIIRNIAQTESCVVDGRDIGTAVLPQADYKFYIVASIEKRAKRRLEQLKRKNKLDSKDLNKVKIELENRDKRDKTRKNDPLKIPEEAVIIDTTNEKVKDTVNKILSYIKKGE